jgi:FtsZ-binding cell division protein ZapB
MSAISTYQQFADTIEVYKGRIEQLREENKTLKKLLSSSHTNNNNLNYGIDDLEQKLAQYQEAAWKLCQAIHYEQPDEVVLSHSTRECISNFTSLWNDEDKKVFDEILQPTTTLSEQ